MSYSSTKGQNIFINDGSFLEVFKRFEQQQQQMQAEIQMSQISSCEAPTTLPEASNKQSVTKSYTTHLPIAKPTPIVFKRKNKVLKLGVIKKIKPNDDKKSSEPTLGALSLYPDEFE